MLWCWLNDLVWVSDKDVSAETWVMLDSVGCVFLDGVGWWFNL